MAAGNIRSSAERVMVTMEKTDIAWMDEQAAKLERSRSWMVETAIRRWRQKLEREAERRAKRRAKAVQSQLTQ